MPNQRKKTELEEARKFLHAFSKKLASQGIKITYALDYLKPAKKQKNEPCK